MFTSFDLEYFVIYLRELSQTAWYQNNIRTSEEKYQNMQVFRFNAAMPDAWSPRLSRFGETKSVISDLNESTKL